MDDIHKALYGGTAGYGGSQSYGRPILASIYNILGLLLLVLAGLALALGFAEPGLPHLEIIEIVAAGIVTALLLFGTAQVVDYIGRTAYNTAQGRDAEILDMLTKIERHLAADQDGRSN